ncbi:MAG: hypothetical protein DRH15_11925 [Deltaproteobacteria bacterium]|nr:MAG: hypothetical protein DRH15_11925 [Deltaproteobacteria bacterium]
MPCERSSLRFLATGIGSVPYLDIETTCRHIILQFPELPFWPQFVKRSPVEDMTLQFTEGLPLVRVDLESKEVRISAGMNKEKELVEFYERFMAEDTDYFAVSEQYAPGLYTMLRILALESGNNNQQFIKGQVVGPITFTASVKGSDGKAVLYDAEILEAMANAISIKALWQVKELSKSGRYPVLFFDEPYLSGFGSAFSPISREKVIQILRTTIDFLKKRTNALVGIHCCGNTDWAMLLETGTDIISFDANGYMDYFLLYDKAIKEFLDRGGFIAWGIVPTSEFTGQETVRSLITQLENGMERLIRSGVDMEILQARSLLTPACGMGTMTPYTATRATNLLSELSRALRHRKADKAQQAS